MERMKNMMENMGRERKTGMMELCFEFMKGKEGGKDGVREEKKKEEPAGFPDPGEIAGCCPGMMERIFLTMPCCFAEKGKEKKDGKEETTEKRGCS